ncbi:MAG: DUF4402 domain-containing protein [Gracilimonas sp.]|uniref:DUF4402 domain-containing protein n=1 Tax=Gracilimonas sp. TaxID=1974203 RepID=UPI0019AC9CFA|nr:DUF4402 domain-containing protein [Gracilimonas sp.]MBD3615487.1 DUF4402 domain-containing protein [Gracilimonas sp.]
MKNALIIALFIILGLQQAYGQSSEDNRISADINVSAQVMQSIELITVNSIRFGDMQPEQGEIYINPITSLNAGYMIAIGTPESEFRLNYLPQRELVQTNGSSSITFTYEISGSSREDQSTSELLEIDNRNIRFNSEGRYYIWVGGRIDLQNAAPGSYQGDFTIEIDYI